jgi:DNA repair exonuclease SbcCD ATPase subunit
MRFHRRDRKNPSRKPHPDPVVETQLQRIISLQQNITTKREQITSYTDKIAALLEQNRYLTTRHPAYWHEHQQMIAVNDKRVTGLQDEIRRLEADIDATHQAIIKLEAELDPTDLAFLHGSPR